MHFLSHYYTELPENEPLFVAGLTIPDLTSNFTRVYNSVILKTPEPTDIGLKHIHRGIIRHFAGDKWFHNSALFLEHLSVFSRSLMSAGLNRERLRLSLIAHLALEMMIDRQIVLQKPEVCRGFYEKIDAADEGILTDYFNRLSLENEKRSFISRFQFFKQRRFIFLFEDLENIVFGINRIYTSVTSTELTEEEKRKFLSALNNIDNTMRYSWQEFLRA